MNRKVKKLRDTINKIILRLNDSSEKEPCSSLRYESRLALREWRLALKLVEHVFGDNRRKTKYGFESLNVGEFTMISANENIHSAAGHYNKRNNVLIKALKMKDGIYRLSRER